ncbi:MAG: EamA family transporter [Nanoarchaeota archaeon]|mgnify:CR=1 FL=1
MNTNYLSLISAILVFSSMGLFVKFISVNGLIIYFCAALIATIIFGISLLKDKKLKDFFTKRNLLIPILIGLFGAVNNSAYFYAYQLTTIANATFSHYLFPILVILLAPLIINEKSKRKSWFLLILSLAGLLILLNPTNLDLSSKNTFGIFLGIVSAFGSALTILLFKKASTHYNDKEILFSQMFFSVIILLPFILYQKPTILLADILPLLLLGIVHQGFNVLLFIKAVTKLPAQNVSLITYLEPVGAVILSLIFLKEIPHLYTLIGGLLILTSCYFTIKDKFLLLN